MPRTSAEEQGRREALGRILAERREALGLSLAGIVERVAEAGVRITRQTVSNWERGAGEPGLTLAAAIARAYETRVDDLVGIE